MGANMAATFAYVAKFAVALLNKITALAGATALILHMNTGGINALRVENPSSSNLLTITQTGAFAVGAGLSVGNNGDCLKSTAGGTMTYGTCGAGGGTTFGSGQVITIGDTRYLKLSGGTMTGVEVVNITGGGNTTVGINNRNAYSGSTITASKNLTSSGSAEVSNNLTVKGITSGATLYVASSLTGDGLTSCSNAVTSKLLWNSVTGQFSCGTDQNTGTTYTAGQGLTLASTSFKTNATETGTLTSYQTVSGSTVYAKNTLTSSGSLKILGNISGATLNVNGLQSCTNVQTNSAGRASCNQTVYLTTDTVYTAGQGITAAGNSFKLSTTNSGTLSTYQIQSGSTVYAKNTLTSSGGLKALGTISGSMVYGAIGLSTSGSSIIQGTMSGGNVYAATSFKGSGLVDCANGTTSKLLWTASTGRFSCGTDQTGAASNWSNTGSLSLYFDNRFVRQAGSTMTGALTVNITGGGNTTVGINNRNAYSGSTLVVQKNLTSSGSAEIANNALIKGILSGASLYIGSSVTGDGLASCNGTNNALQWSSMTGRFGCSAVMETTALNNNNVWVGNGSNVAAATPLPSCFNGTTNALEFNTVTNTFSCVTITDVVYTAGQGLTLSNTSFKINATLTGTTLKGWTTISGSSIQADAALTSSGVLTVKGAVTLKNTVNCAFMTTNANGLVSCGASPFKNLILSAGGATVQTTSGSEAIQSNFGTNVINVQEQAYSGTGGGPRYAQWTATMPQSYNGGTMTGSFIWTTTTNPNGSANNTVKWGIQCIAYGSGSAIDAAWGTSQTVSQTIGASTKNVMQVSAATPAITCAGSPAGGKPIQFRVFRDPSVANNLQGTGRLLQVILRFPLNSLTD